VTVHQLTTEQRLPQSGSSTPRTAARPTQSAPSLNIRRSAAPLLRNVPVNPGGVRGRRNRVLRDPHVISRQLAEMGHKAPDPERLRAFLSSGWVYGSHDQLMTAYSTKYLDEMHGSADMSTWSAGKPHLANAHHKLPKSAIGWMWERLNEGQQTALRKDLFLGGKSAGAKSVARLPGLLIAPRAQGVLEPARSDVRTDDPHNNRQQSEQGEEYLDLVRATSGELTPRSREVQALAHGPLRTIHDKYVAHPDKAAFKVDDEDFQGVRQHLVAVQKLHAAIEPDVTRPSHSQGDAFVQAGVDQRFHKTPVQQPTVPPGIDLDANYEAKQAALTRDSRRTRREIIERFHGWQGRESKDLAEDDAKSLFNSPRSQWVRHIHGEHRGRQVYDDQGQPIQVRGWQTQLARYQRLLKTKEHTDAALAKSEGDPGELRATKKTTDEEIEKLEGEMHYLDDLFSEPRPPAAAQAQSPAPAK
jgi:hypothetical protein